MNGSRPALCACRNATAHEVLYASAPAPELVMPPEGDAGAPSQYVPVVEQRAGTSETARAETEHLWSPEGLPAGIVPEPTDAYVVIDDLADGVAVLSSAPWPHLDKAGRLVFRTSAVEFPDHFGRAQRALQNRVDELRAPHAEPELAARPIRIGDVFLVRGFSKDLDLWELAVDVTPQARTAAKIALFGAIAPRVTGDQAAELGLRGAPRVPTTPAPTGRSSPPASGASPAV